MKTYTPEDLDTMVHWYLRTMLWIDTAGEDMDDIPLEELFDVDDIPEDVVERARKDCADFLDQAIEKNLLTTNDFEQIGYDFWLTRNHHGVGFWDRPLVYGYDKKDRLTDLADSFGEVWSSAWRDDDGNLQLTID